jgi:hypothetical protein
LIGSVSVSWRLRFSEKEIDAEILQSRLISLHPSVLLSSERIEVDVVSTFTERSHTVLLRRLRSDGGKESHSSSSRVDNSV